MKGIKFRSTGRCVPERVITNGDLAKKVDTSDEWITSRTGIRRRHHLAEGETLTALAAAAARQALERAGITARVLRSPKSISGEGCSHSVKISQRTLPDSLRILQRVGLTPKRIYITAGDGSYQEVAL